MTEPLTRACVWCGTRSTVADNPTRCPDCRAPWPTIAQPVGLREKPQQIPLELDGQERAPWA